MFNPSVPAWWPLIPGKGGIPLVSLRGNEDGGEIWERYEDEFAEILDEELPEDI